MIRWYDYVAFVWVSKAYERPSESKIILGIHNSKLVITKLRSSIPLILYIKFMSYVNPNPNWIWLGGKILVINSPRNVKMVNGTTEFIALPSTMWSWRLTNPMLLLRSPRFSVLTVVSSYKVRSSLLFPCNLLAVREDSWYLSLWIHWSHRKQSCNLP